MSAFGILNALQGVSSRAKINADMTNRELVERVEKLLEEKKTPSDKKKNPSKIMHLEYADPAAKESFDRKRDAILKAIEAIDAGQA